MVQGTYTAVRMFNTNVVLALDAEHSRVVICTGKGVAFGLSQGERVPGDKIEAVFVPEDSGRSQALAQALGLTDPHSFDAAQAICQMAGRRLGLARPEILVLAVADHLDQAQRRARQGVTVDIPLVWEVAHLYPNELEAGRCALEIAREHLGVELPDSEATAFALHFVGAQFDEVPVDQTVRMTRTLEGIFDVLDTNAGQPLQRWDQPAARFIAHLRFLFARLGCGEKGVGAPEAVARALADVDPLISRSTDDIAEVIEREWGWHVGDDERAYIALHVYRLFEPFLTERDRSGPRSPSRRHGPS